MSVKVTVAVYGVMKDIETQDEQYHRQRGRGGGIDEIGLRDQGLMQPNQSCHQRRGHLQSQVETNGRAGSAIHLAAENERRTKRRTNEVRAAKPDDNTPRRKMVLLPYRSSHHP